MKHIVKWGIVGLGNIAFEFAKAFHNADNAELIAIASKTDTKITKFKNEFKLKEENIYNDYESILDNKNIDIFYMHCQTTFILNGYLKQLKKKIF